MKIAVVGMGYVGYTLAILLAKKYQTYAIDTDTNKINMMKNDELVIKDISLSTEIDKTTGNLYPIENGIDIYKDMDYVFIAVPTNFDEKTKFKFPKKY